jgi:hypothetical protein
MVPRLCGAVYRGFAGMEAVIRLDASGAFMTPNTDAAGARADVEPPETRPAAREAAWRLADGAEAALVDGALELRDADGRLLFRYRDGAAELHAPRGDLSLDAPTGRVVLCSGSDLELEAGRSLRQQADESVSVRAGAGASAQLALEHDAIHLAAPRLEARAEHADFVSTEATLAARTITTTAERLAERVGRYELTANRVIEQAQHAFREVAGLLQSRVGRARTVARELYELRSKRTVLRSKEETTIDGNPVRLG